MKPTSGEFEIRRQVRETRNELVVNALFAGIYFFIFVFQAVLHFAPWAPIHTTVRMIVSDAIIWIVCAAIALYVRSAPPYRQERKYVITTIHTIVIGQALHAALVLNHPEFTMAVSIAALSTLIVFSGLRYSWRVVLFTGVLAFVTHIVIVLSAPAGPLRVVAIGLGAAVIAGTSASAGLVVSGLLKLHGDSIASERLGRFFAPEIVERIRLAPELTLGAVEKEVTVLFSDLTGFTSMSSTMRPAEVVALLNEYFPAMVDIVYRHQGTLEKYIGDALLAVWGAPVDQPDAADRAVRTALEMQQKIAELNRGWATQGRVQLTAHIGIHSGRVAAGHIGSERHLQYAVIGDTTNVASRICSAASSGEVLISEESRAKLGITFPMEPLDLVHVKGKTEPLRLWRVTDRAGS